MQKIITISALTAVLSLPTFAEIANNATCNNTNLGQSNNNSTANVEANWNANTININWYNGDTRVAQNTCTYDGSITLPTEPTKPGYTFSGWRLRAAPVAPNCNAINNSTTCGNTDGCFWIWGGEQICVFRTEVNSAPYSKCSDITDQSTCLSIFGMPGTDIERDHICSWDRGACKPYYAVEWVTGTRHLYIPKSWCDEFVAANSNCSWTGDYRSERRIPGVFRQFKQ